MKILILIVGIVIFAKIFLFWLWLWQLKEYRFDRFRAHFDTIAFRKIASGFWRLKLPKFTKKIVVIFFSGLILAAFLSLCSFFALFLLIILAPLFSSFFILSFQLPAALWKKTVIQRAKQKRAKFKNLLVVGITGSYGKTSTKEFLATILSGKFNVLKTKEHQNTEIGVSQCILNDLKKEHEIFVCEMGAYKKGEIKLLCDIAKPKIGILTGINEQHMATFGSQENIIKAKFELIESLPEDGMAFFNAKNKYCLDLYDKINIKKFFYGQETKFFGEENILGAMAVAKELSMTDGEISKRVEKIENKFPGIQIEKGIEGINVIDATYSANPDGVISHLEYLKIWTGKKVIIMPCLIELGKASKEVHKRIGQKIGEVCDLAIITTKDRFKEIVEEALLRPASTKVSAGEQGYGRRETKILFLENSKEIFEKIKTFCSQGDVILLESRVPGELIKELII